MVFPQPCSVAFFCLQILVLPYLTTILLLWQMPGPDEGVGVETEGGPEELEQALAEGEVLLQQSKSFKYVLVC